MMMPIMNGLETAKKIQRMIDDNEISNEIKIIIVSAHIEENLLKQLKNIKCIVEMVHKPLKKTKLNELLNKYYFAN
jgi:CheY-like chemotaxis protein